MITHSGMAGIMTTYQGDKHGGTLWVTAHAGLGRRVNLAYDHNRSWDDNHAAAVQALCNKFKWTGDLRSGGHERGMYFVFLET